MAPARSGETADADKKLISFVKAASVLQSSSHQYAANIHPGWCFGPVAHGGYLVSVAWEAVRLHFATTLKQAQQSNTVSLHTEFLRHAMSGEVVVHVEDVKLGRSMSTVGFSLMQAGKKICTGFATCCGSRSKMAPVSLNLGYSQPPAPPPVDFEAMLQGRDKSWIRYDVVMSASMGNLTFKNFTLAYPRQHAQTPAEKRVSQQWMCHRLPEQRWTTPMLGVLLDSATPPPENFYPSTTFAQWAEEDERSGKKRSRLHPPWRKERMYTTTNTTIDVKRQLPEEGEKWLLVISHTKEVVEGRFDVGAEVWDAQGCLIATAYGLWELTELSKPRGGGSSTKGKEHGAKLGKL